MNVLRPQPGPQTELLSSSADIVFYGGAAGGGKCQRRGERVLLADGKTCAVEDVQVGDRLAGDAGPVTVMSTHSGRDAMVKVTPVKGDAFYVTEDHVHTLVHPRGSTRDVPITWAATKAAHHRWKLKRSEALSFEGVPFGPLPLDPYFLGLYLGDGCSSQPGWSLRNRLTNLGLVGLKSGDKFIPDSYKRGSLETRRALLSGLFDADGSKHRSGLDYISKSERMAQDVVFVCRSLGLAAYMHPCQKGCQTGAVGTYYRVSVSGKLSEQLSLKIVRKRPEPRRQVKDVLHTSFHTEPAGKDEYFGFAVSGNHRYLMADFTVTHNSFGIGMDAARWLWTPGYKSLIVREAYDQLMGPDGLFDIVQSITATWPGIKVIASQNPEIGIPKLKSRIVFRHMQMEKTKKKHKGLQYAGIYADEVTDLTESQWWYLLSRMRTTCGIKAYARATCNPEPGWVAKLIDWWIDEDGFAISQRSGVIRWLKRDPITGIIHWFDHPEEGSKSFTFIMARLADNKYLGQDYADNLALQEPLEYARLMLGNWKTVESPGDHFKREWCRWVTHEPDGVFWVRAWDKAATPDVKADWTSGVRVGRTKEGRILIDMRSIERMQKGPDCVLEAQRRCATQDGLTTMIGGWQDPAQAGIVDITVTRRNVGGFAFKSIIARKHKWEYWRPVTEAAKAGEIDLLGPPGPNAEAFLAVLEGVPTKGRPDDDFDALALGYNLVHEKPTISYKPAKPDRSRFMLG